MEKRKSLPPNSIKPRFFLMKGDNRIEIEKKGYTIYDISLCLYNHVPLKPKLRRKSLAALVLQACYYVPFIVLLLRQ